MKTINEDIKKESFKQMYLLFGEEAYLKKQYKDKLTKALVPPDDTINYNYFEGKDINPGEIVSLADTMPFFAERRLIVVENSGFFKGSANELADYIKNCPDTTFFIFVESEIDKRSKLFKAVKSAGYVAEMKKQDDKTLMVWIVQQVKREKHQIRESTVRYLLSKTGPDMENLQNEMNKLFAYTMGRNEITRYDVDEICVTQINNRIFDMVESVARKDLRAALDYYYDLLALKEPPMRILFLLVRQFRLLLEVKSMKSLGWDNDRIARETGLQGFVVRKYIAQSRAFDTEEIRNILEEAADLEESVKTGRLTDRMSVELFIVKFSK